MDCVDGLLRCRMLTRTKIKWEWKSRFHSGRFLNTRWNSNPMMANGGRLEEVCWVGKALLFNLQRQGSEMAAALGIQKNRREWNAMCPQVVSAEWTLLSRARRMEPLGSGAVYHPQRMSGRHSLSQKVRRCWGEVISRAMPLGHNLKEWRDRSSIPVLILGCFGYLFGPAPEIQ